MKIKKIRKEKGITQVELGEMVGLGIGKKAGVRISQYESGNRVPKEKTMIKLAYSLGVKLEDINLENYIKYKDIIDKMIDYLDIKMNEAKNEIENEYSLLERRIYLKVKNKVLSLINNECGE